ncbi:MAG: cell wall hydrolase [Caulobacteraceae bacterium]|nr:cell wall hydrolase [Caulobacteraceae bacterium]
MADTHTAHTARLAQAAAQGFSESALRAETQAMDPGAVALAQRHDSLASASVAATTRVSAPIFTARAATTSPTTVAAAPRPTLMRASFASITGPAARPFHFASGGALQSARDLDCLTDAVYYEARGETAAGQAAVAQVVLNRVRHPAFPKSVCGVVFQRVAEGDGCQFSFACDGSMHRPRESEAWRRSEQIAARALSGFVMPSIGNATHFHVIGIDPGWGPRLLRVAQIGLHVFYRFGGYAGSPSSFSGQAQHSDDAAPAAPRTFANTADVTADGRPAGQYILASVTSPGPGPATPASMATTATVIKTASRDGAGTAEPASVVKTEGAGAKPHADAGL